MTPKNYYHAGKMDSLFIPEELNVRFVERLTKRLRLIYFLVSRVKKENINKKERLTLIFSLLRESENLSDAAFMYKKEDLYLKSARFHIDVIELQKTLSKRYNQDALNSIEKSLMKLTSAIFECQNEIEDIQTMALDSLDQPDGGYLS